MSTRMLSDPSIARTSVSLTLFGFCHPDYAVWHAVAQEIVGISPMSRVGGHPPGGIPQPWSLMLALQNRELLPQNEVSEQEAATCAEEVEN